LRDRSCAEDIKYEIKCCERLINRLFSNWNL